MTHYFEKILGELQSYKDTFEGFVRARNPYELRYFVIGKHADRIQQYKQLLVEMEAKWRAVEEANYITKKRILEREELCMGKIACPKVRADEIHNEKIDLEVEKLDRENHHTELAKLGALKEVANFIQILDGEFADLKGKDEEELLVHEMDYWEKRLAKQCQIDMLTEGRIGKGNLDVLMDLPRENQKRILVQASYRLDEHKETLALADKEFIKERSLSTPKEPQQIAAPIYQPLMLVADASDTYPVHKIVQMDRVEIMIATLHRPGDREWIGREQYIPAGKNYIAHWLECPSEDLIGEYKNKLVLDALSLGCTHILILDDDVAADTSVLQKLYAHDLDIVGGWYPKKTPVKESSTLISDGKSKKGVPLSAKGLIEIDWSLAAGCTLYNTNVFRKIPYPWFLTTARGTEDTFLTQKAMQYGIPSYLDCDIKCGHVDKKSRVLYAFDTLSPAAAL